MVVVGLANLHRCSIVLEPTHLLPFVLLDALLQSRVVVPHGTIMTLT